MVERWGLTALPLITSLHSAQMQTPAVAACLRSWGRYGDPQKEPHEPRVPLCAHCIAENLHAAEAAESF